MKEQLTLVAMLQKLIREGCGENFLSAEGVKALAEKGVYTEEEGWSDTWTTHLETTYDLFGEVREDGYIDIMIGWVIKTRDHFSIESNTACIGTIIPPVIEEMLPEHVG